MKIIKLIFSRMFLVGLTILLLFVAFLGLVVLGFYGLEAFLAVCFPAASGYIQLIFTLLMYAVTLITVLHVVNRDMIPEAKIPWLLCVVGLSVLGVAIYAVFSHNRPSRRHRRIYSGLNEQMRKFSERAVPEGELKEEYGRWYPMSASLAGTGARVYSHTKTEYFPSGEAFFARYLEDLKGAKKFIFLEYFILMRGKLWNSVLEILKEKVKEGVEVRVMYDDVGCMGKVWAGYHRQLRKAGIKARKFNPFVPVVSNIHNYRDHRKITVIDGKIGYTGGLNLADEYINETHPFGYWKDTAVRLEGRGVEGLTLMFLRLYTLSSHSHEEVAQYIPGEYEEFEGEGYVQPYGSGPKLLYDRMVAEEVYLNILGEAKEYVYITTPYLIIDYRIRTALLSAAARGVDVRIVVPHIPDKKTAFALTRSNYMALIKGGVKIYEYTPGFIHAKSFLADDKIAVVGTVNLDYRSLIHHFEDALLLYGTRAGEQLKEDFAEIFSQSALQTEEDAKKSVVWRGLCEIMKVFAPLF